MCPLLLLVPVVKEKEKEKVVGCSVCFCHTGLLTAGSSGGGGAAGTVT